MAEKTLGFVAYETYCVAEEEHAWQAVADAVVAAHEARRWRPIETAPKHLYVDVIAAGRRIPNAKQSPTMTGGDNWRWWSNGAMILEDVTHWTPIPAPPKEGE